MVKASRGLRFRLAIVWDVASSRHRMSNPSSTKNAVTHQGFVSPSLARFITRFSASTSAMRLFRPSFSWPMCSSL